MMSRLKRFWIFLILRESCLVHLRPQPVHTAYLKRLIPVVGTCNLSTVLINAQEIFIKADSVQKLSSLSRFPVFAASGEAVSSLTIPSLYKITFGRVE